MSDHKIDASLFNGLQHILDMDAVEESCDINLLIARYGTTERFVRNDNPVLSPDEFEAIANPVRRMFDDK